MVGTTVSSQIGRVYAENGEAERDCENLWEI